MYLYHDEKLILLSDSVEDIDAIVMFSRFCQNLNLNSELGMIFVSQVSLGSLHLLHQ